MDDIIKIALEYQTGKKIENENDFDEARSKLPSVFRKRNRKPRLSRFYKVICRRDDEIVTFERVTSQKASRIKREFRGRGYRVDLLEISNLTGIVNRDDTPSTDKIPAPVPFSSRPRNNSYVNRQRLLSLIRTNETAARKAVKNESLKLYEKQTSRLRFAGTLQEMVDYLSKLKATDSYNAADWVLYVPSKIYDKLVEVQYVTYNSLCRHKGRY